jgi:hypothetical protein
MYFNSDMKNNKLSDRSIDISILEKIEKNKEKKDISIDLSKIDNTIHKTHQKIKGGSKKNSRGDLKNNGQITYKKEWYKKNSKNVKNYNKEYYEKHKEKHKEKMLEMYYKNLKNKK